MPLNITFANTKQKQTCRNFNLTFPHFFPISKTLSFSFQSLSNATAKTIELLKNGKSYYDISLVINKPASSIRSKLFILGLKYKDYFFIEKKCQFCEKDIGGEGHLLIKRDGHYRVYENQIQRDTIIKTWNWNIDSQNAFKYVSDLKDCSLICLLALLGFGLIIIK